MADAGLPSIGVSLNKKGVHAKNSSKVGLWSAVALQQHFRKQGAYAVVPGAVDDKGAPVAINTRQLPPPQQHGQLTLAQKMGLVPQPPPEPTREDWKATEQRALLREKLQPLGDQLCGICLERFYETREEAQIILSCSHVFHEKCFQTFERLTRQRMREEGADVAVRLACPECRETHYYKKKYFASKALAQRTALVKIQALARGFLARRRYTKMRLEQDPKFREQYAKAHLEALSRSWETHLENQEKKREAVLHDVDAVQQSAAAAYLTEEDWRRIIERRVEMDKDYVSSTPETVHSAVLRETADVLEQAGLPFHQCPICLDRIQPSTDLFSTNDEDNRASEYLKELRKEYEQKKMEKEKLQRQKESKRKPAPRATSKKREVKKTTKPATHQETTATTVKKQDGGNASPPPAVAIDTDDNRKGLILSCTHCFHDACLSAFEHYNEWRAVKDGHQVVRKCPICRSGYATHPF